MTTHLSQDPTTLLADPIAQQLLQSTIPARLAYTWTNGTPRVVPIWFHWNGEAFVLGTPPRAPKLKALAADPRVALAVDGTEWPYKVLLVRGRAAIDEVDGVAPEYAAAARRYFGAEAGAAWVQQVSGMIPRMVRLTIRPDWVRILDFETRLPSALAP